MQEIVVDYVHGEMLKYAMLLGNTFFCSVVGLAGIYAVIKLSYGV
jgi:succinate dehydrogenase / fumarate reductase membrane anchor subunit